MSLLEASICSNAAIIKLKHYFDVESSVAGPIMKYNAVTSWTSKR